MNEDTAGAFEARVAQMRSAAENEIVAAFPFRELSVVGPIAAFYEMYGVKM